MDSLEPHPDSQHNAATDMATGLPWSELLDVIASRNLNVTLALLAFLALCSTETILAATALVRACRSGKNGP